MTFCLGFGAGAYLSVLSPILLSSELSVPLQHLVQCHHVQVNIPGWAPWLSMAMHCRVLCHLFLVAADSMNDAYGGAVACHPLPTQFRIFSGTEDRERSKSMGIGGLCSHPVSGNTVPDIIQTKDLSQSFFVPEVVARAPHGVSLGCLAVP